MYNTTYAAHVLGRLSPIYQEDWVGDPDNGIVGYRDKGYSMDALVGESGVEKAFEEYLHGENGTKLITTTSDGQITGEFYTKEPKPGNTVALTLDIDLQEDVEKALSKTIGDMTEKDGIRRGGAAVVVGVGSGEVLALASYPTYDISKWDEIYDTLASDDKGAPLFNRAIGGTYAPGSTFKPCTAVAALESRCHHPLHYHSGPGHLRLLLLPPAPVLDLQLLRLHPRAGERVGGHHRVLQLLLL